MTSPRNLKLTTQEQLKRAMGLVLEKNLPNLLKAKPVVC
jgi:hypothetical protein